LVDDRQALACEIVPPAPVLVSAGIDATVDVALP
jgi:hypothetical protein